MTDNPTDYPLGEDGGSGVEMTKGMHDALVSLSDDEIRHAATWLADRTESSPDLSWWERLTSGLVYELLAERYVRKHTAEARALEIDRAMARAYYLDVPDDVLPPLPTRTDVVTLHPDDSFSVTPVDQPPPSAA